MLRLVWCCQDSIIIIIIYFKAVLLTRFMHFDLEFHVLLFLKIE